MLLKAHLIVDANVGVSTLPDFALKSKFFFGTVRKAALDQLHCFLKSHLSRNRHQDVKMIGHDDEVVKDNML